MPFSRSTTDSSDSKRAWRPVRMLSIRTSVPTVDTLTPTPAPTRKHTTSHRTSRTLSLRNDGTFDISTSPTSSVSQNSSGNSYCSPHSRSTSGSTFSSAGSRSSRSSSLVSSPVTPGSTDECSSIYSSFDDNDVLSIYPDDMPAKRTTRPAFPISQRTSSLRAPRALVFRPFESGATHDQFMDSLEACDLSVSRPACPARSAGHTKRAHEHAAAHRSVIFADDADDAALAAHLNKAPAGEYLDLINGESYTEQRSGIAVVGECGRVVGWF